MLGCSISPNEFQQCIQSSEQLNPKVGKLWADGIINAGLYIVSSGKARLLDHQGDLITTLETGDFFGEFTLFPERRLQSYTVRASANLNLCFIPSATLEKVLLEYDLVKDHLWQTSQSRQKLLGSMPSSTSKAAVATLHSPQVKDQGSVKASKPKQIESEPRIGKAYFPSFGQRVGHLWQRTVKKYPFFAQQSGSDCGAACLVMVARYWGKKVSVNKLRDIASVDRNGASLLGLSVAAESIGLSTRPVKASLKQLAKQKLPAIVHWEGKHYIVVYQVTSKQVVIADPGFGQSCLSHEEFKQKWTGYTLLLQPTALLKEIPEYNTPFWQFLELLKPHKLVIFEVFIASIFVQVFGLITPLFTQLILDRVVVQRSELTLATVGIGLFVFSMFRVAMIGLRQYLLDHTANRLDMALIIAFFRHTLRLPLSFFESRYVGDIISRVQENRKIQRFLSGEAIAILLDLMTVFIYFGLMFWYSWRMALLAMLIIPPFLLLALVATPFLQRISREVFVAHASENSYLIEALTGIRTVKSTAVEQTVRWHWEELLHKAIKSNFSSEVISNRLRIFSNALESAITGGLLCYGAYLVIHDQLTIGQLVAFNLLLGNVVHPFQRLIVLWNEVQEVAIAVERINDVLEAEPEEDLHKSARRSLKSMKGQIKFENVTFRYHPEGDVNILENLTFEIQPGQMVAIVGRSGSGKTTISKLVLGLYPPTDGRILIDGHDITTLSLSSVRQQTGVVDQDTFLFGGTIRENISLSHPGAPLEEIIAAAKLAGADGFIKKMPMSYEAQIGEGGGMLSGGQRQRLAITRALVGNARLLILDEATSHLDSESERIIQNNLKDILKGRTTIVIAHRLSTIRHADLILVLNQGMLVEQGCYEELMNKRGHFFYLNQQQMEVVE